MKKLPKKVKKDSAKSKVTPTKPEDKAEGGFNPILQSGASKIKEMDKEASIPIIRNSQLERSYSVDELEYLAKKTRRSTEEQLVEVEQSIAHYNSMLNRISEDKERLSKDLSRLNFMLNS